MLITWFSFRSAADKQKIPDNFGRRVKCICLLAELITDMGVDLYV